MAFAELKPQKPISKLPIEQQCEEINKRLTALQKQLHEVGQPLTPPAIRVALGIDKSTLGRWMEAKSKQRQNGQIVEILSRDAEAGQENSQTQTDLYKERGDIIRAWFDLAEAELAGVSASPDSKSAVTGANYQLGAQFGYTNRDETSVKLSYEELIKSARARQIARKRNQAKQNKGT